MSGRDKLLKQIRVLGKGTRGASPAILELADDTLYEVFEQLKRGLSCRAVARYLRSIGMNGSENSLQQTLSLLRKRVAPLLRVEESAAPALPQAAHKLPENFSSLPHEEALSTLTEVVKNYGEWLRQVTQKAAQNGTPISEDVAKHMKAYDTLLARKTRLEQNAVKDTPVQSTGEDPEDSRFLEALANKAHDWLFADGDGDEMIKASKRFLARLAPLCIQVEKDPVTGKWRKVTGRPERNRTYNERISD